MKHVIREKIRHGTPEINFAVYDHLFPAPDDSFDGHWHPEIEMEYVYTGSVDFLLDGRRYTLGAGDLLIVNKNVIHASEIPRGGCGRYVSVVFGEQFVFSSYGDGLYSAYLAPLLEKGMGFPPVLPPGEARDRILAHVRQLLACWFENRFARELSARSHLLGIYSTALEQGLFVREDRPRGSAAQLVRSAMQTLQQEYAGAVRIGELAAGLGVSPQYLCRIFKDAVGKTPLEFLLSCRLRQAQYLLTQTDTPISDIAAACGFEDFNYFSRFFKKLHHMSPRSYRAKYRQTAPAPQHGVE